MTSDTTPDMSARAITRRVAMILDAAHDDGLPPVRYVHIYVSGYVTFSLPDTPALLRWVDWRGVDRGNIETLPAGGARLFHMARFDMYDLKVDVNAFEDVTDEQGAPAQAEG